MTKRYYTRTICNYWTMALLIVIFDWHGIQIISAAAGATVGVLLSWWVIERHDKRSAHSA